MGIRQTGLEENGEPRYSLDVHVVNVDGSTAASRVNLFNGASALKGPDIVFTSDSAFNRVWTIPEGRECTPVQIYAELTTSAIVGTRTLLVTYEAANGAIFGEFAASTTQLLSVAARKYTFGKDVANKLGSIPLVGGMKVRVRVDGGQTGDNITVARLVVMERILV